jgi:hypothetical protein
MVLHIINYSVIFWKLDPFYLGERLVKDSIISGSQIFVLWTDLVLNLQFGRHVSWHKHSVKGINTTPSFKSPIWVLHRTELVLCWMPMFPILFNVDAWDKVPTVFILYFGFWGSQTIDYFELIWLVEGPFNAKFNHHGSSHFSTCLWPTIVHTMKGAHWIRLWKLEDNEILLKRCSWSFNIFLVNFIVLELFQVDDMYKNFVYEKKSNNCYLTNYGQIKVRKW